MIRFKSGVQPLELMNLQPFMQMLLKGAYHWHKQNDLTMVITSIKSDREGVESKSSTHEDYRAVDIRTRHMSDEQIAELVDHLCTKFIDIAAISAKDHIARAAIYHNEHIHLQVRRQGTLEKWFL